MRIGNRVVFWGIALFFLLAGLGLVAAGSHDPLTEFLDDNATADSDPSGDVLPLIGWIWAAVAVFLILLGLVLGRGGRRDRGLQETGFRAPARIEGVATTGVILNHVNTGVRIDVTVMPPGEPEFPARIKTYVPVAALPQPGDVALVAYDLADRDRITFVEDERGSFGGGKSLVAPDGRPLWLARQTAAAEAAAGAKTAAAAAADDARAPSARRDDGELSVVEQLERLAALHEKGVLTDAEFQAQKYRILSGS